MIKFVGMASEHKLIPNRLLLSSESTARTRRDYWMSRDDQLTPYNEYSYDQYCTYAWIETDEIEVHNDYNNEIPIAVMDYKPRYSKRTQFVFEEPIWEWIEEMRTDDEQRWISRNIEKLNEIFKEFADIDNN